MKVTYAGTELASGGLQGATEMSFNGRQVNDEAGYIRAAAQSYFERANRSTLFSFGVNRTFNGEAATLTFGATHLNDLATSGDVVVTDDLGTVSFTLADAVLESVSIPRVDGTYVFVRYSFSGGVFS